MTKRNELLEKDIQERIGKARNHLPEKEKQHRSLFNTIVIALISIAVLISLFRFMF